VFFFIFGGLLRAFAFELCLSGSPPEKDLQVFVRVVDRLMVGRVDEYDRQPIFFGCVVCHGRKLRSRRSKGSLNCKHHSCRRGLRELNNDPDAGPVPVSTPTTCFRVDQVYGVSLTALSTLSGREKRAGPELDDSDMMALVRGGFGEDADDSLIPDTRWVELFELVDNMEEEELNKLDAFATTLKKNLLAARKRRRASTNDDDEHE
tara:strand:- start:185 stop:802 length:618 start_codon:yes stop_codon:yes gene_type:complete